MVFIRAYVSVSGRVQGVFFRYETRSKALELGLTGWVRNLPDGRVEVIAEGKDENVNQLIEICKQGPAFVDVKNVDVEEMQHQGYKDFKVSRL